MIITWCTGLIDTIVAKNDDVLHVRELKSNYIKTIMQQFVLHGYILCSLFYIMPHDNNLNSRDTLATHILLTMDMVRIHQ